MFLNNYYKAFCDLLFLLDLKPVNTSGETPYAFLSPGSNVYNIFATSDAPSSPSVYHVRDAYASNGGVIFGNGNVAPTMDDYCLSGDIISNINFSVNVTITSDDNGASFTGVYTITNNNDMEITISEVALKAASKNGTDLKYQFLLERTVLDTPVTIPSGGVGQVTYTIRFNYPTA